MNETPRQRFIRIAEKRANRIIREVSILGNCGDRKNYDYDEEQINAIFGTIDSAVLKAKSRFSSKKIDKVKL